MGWLFDFALQGITELFGESLAKDQPWWVRALAELGCIVALLLVFGLVWLVFVSIRP